MTEVLLAESRFDGLGDALLYRAPFLLGDKRAGLDGGLHHPDIVLVGEVDLFQLLEQDPLHGRVRRLALGFEQQGQRGVQLPGREQGRDQPQTGLGTQVGGGILLQQAPVVRAGLLVVLLAAQDLADQEVGLGDVFALWRGRDDFL